MTNSNAGTTHVNSLTMIDRVKLVDWLRAEKDAIPTRTVAENVEAAIAHLGHPCSAQQLRDLAKAANVAWTPMMPARTGGGAAGSSRYLRLEKRVRALEQWCAKLAGDMGLDKLPLPTDEELEE